MLTDARVPVSSRSFAPTKSSAAVLYWAGWAFVAIGSALRIREYVAARSLMIDEAFLALNLVERSPRELLDRLAFDQAAPLGFLELEKGAIVLLGASEYVLRAAPLVASLLALALFYRVAREILRPLAATISVAVFALLDPLILYAATTKQYAFDVAAAVFILATAVFLERRTLRGGDLLVLAVLGATLVWLSHAAVFGLAALGLLLVARRARERSWTLLVGAVAVLVAWTASFATQYMLSRTGLTQVRTAFEQGGVGAVSTPDSDPAWFVQAVDRVRYLVGLEDATSGQPILSSIDAVPRGLTLLLVAVGILGLASLLRRNLSVALMLATPAVLAAVASSLGQYPVVSRTLLFVLPSVAICIGEGIAVLLRDATGFLRVPATIAAATCVAAIAVLPVTHAVDTRPSQDMKDVLAYLGANSNDGDGLYVSAGAQYGAAYYTLCDCSPFDPAARWPFTVDVAQDAQSPIASDTATLVAAREALDADLDPLLRRGRTWLLVAESPEEERSAIIEHASAHGRMTQRFETGGPLPAAASLYLFEPVTRP